VIDEQEKLEKKVKQSSPSAQQQTGKAAATTLTVQDPANQRPKELRRGELAASEFAQILNLLNVASAKARFKESQGGCPDIPRWCLSRVNCTARVTMSQSAIAAFKDNHEFCKRTERNRNH
jgi:hypothetical protein